MSLRPSLDPVCSDPPCSGQPEAPSIVKVIAKVIDARPRDIGGFKVRRLLPSVGQRLVGPFIFFDHMGPAALAPGEGMDVRPHPHIGLATVTYLFEGEIVHRDSLGTELAIRPGDINWMTAGRGIVHSERTSAELRRVGYKVHGLQLWVALPVAHEETEPAFHHHPAAALPTVDMMGVELRVLAGTAYGLTSPVHTFSPLFYVDAVMPAGSELTLPREHEERAAYIVAGAVRCNTERAESGRMLVFATNPHVGPDDSPNVILHAEQDTRLVLLGGAPIDGARHIFWNFVSSSKERIEQAKHDWKAGRFPKIPGDNLEFVPLPE